MDHALRTISYIADIGDILVIMARRGPVMSPDSDGSVSKRKNKICCHVFETDEVSVSFFCVCVCVCVCVCDFKNYEEI